MSDLTPQKLAASLTAHTGEARFRFARENFDVLLEGLPKPADLLWYLADEETSEACFDQAAYSSFVIEVTTRLIQRGGVGLRGLGLAIEHCIGSVGRSKRETEQFVDFCNSFGEAIEPLRRPRRGRSFVLHGHTRKSRQGFPRRLARRCVAFASALPLGAALK